MKSTAKDDRVPGTYRCNICGCVLNQPDEPDTKDCGGDCLRCMAEVAEDPDCQAQRRSD